MSNTPVSRGSLIRNWISLTGAVIAVGSFFAFLLLFMLDFFAEHGNPYMGILAYAVAPGFLILGLFLVFLGYWIHRRQAQKAETGATRPLAIRIDLSRPRDRKILGIFVAGSVIFLFVTAVGSYQTYHFTESVQFCGKSCHTPMDPEFITSQHSPHARVDCVACHVGSGAGAYVRTKISGMRQLYHVVRNDFERPIRVSLGKLRPARETCEQCHWPQKFTGGYERVFHHYLADEKNTPFGVRLLVNVGGGNPQRGPVGGIHWHMNIANKIEYAAADDQQRNIPWVRHTDANGVVTEYVNPDFKGDLAKLQKRTMDCLDCHNRPSHNFLSPNEAVDIAMETGRLDPKTPWLKSKVVDALVQPYATQPEALKKIDEALRKTYAGNPKVDTIVSETQSIYKNNFFPEMKADWRSYPDHLSHKEWDGCFRCHDGKHQVMVDGKPAGGKTTTIKADCKACHLILAQGDNEQMTKLNATGYDFIHIDSEYSDFSCAECHTGANPKN
jgi:nitrate/TMAO reductase-like tetraheme cytochrome c subunit